MLGPLLIADVQRALTMLHAAGDGRRVLLD